MEDLFAHHDDHRKQRSHMKHRVEKQQPRITRCLKRGQTKYPLQQYQMAAARYGQKLCQALNDPKRHRF